MSRTALWFKITQKRPRPQIINFEDFFLELHSDPPKWSGGTTLTCYNVIGAKPTKFRPYITPRVRAHTKNSQNYDFWLVFVVKPRINKFSRIWLSSCSHFNNYTWTFEDKENLKIITNISSKTRIFQWEPS